MSSNLCIADFCSFTWSPAPLARLTALARDGAKLKGLPSFAFGPAMRKWCRGNTQFSAKYVFPETGELHSSSIEDWQKYQGELYQTFEMVLSSGSAATRFDVSRELSKMMGDSLSDDEFVAVGGDFHTTYTDLVASYGVQWLDALCWAELDFFVYMLNGQLTLDHSQDELKSGLVALDLSKADRWTYQMKQGGMFGYSHSATLLLDGYSAGVVCWGAANHGCYVSFSGAGCAAVDFHQLYKVLGKLRGCKLTRLDIALDDLTGNAFDVLRAKEWALEGKFTKRRPPRYCYIESGSLSAADVRDKKRRYGFDPSHGRSFYVGSRESGLMCRFYEKGKQLQDEAHPDWQRAEVEIRNVDRIIPFEALLNLDAYFAGAYPVLAELLSSVEPVNVITTKGKRFSVSLNCWVAKGLATRANVVKNAAIQCGRVLNYLSRGENLSSDEIIALLTSHLEPDDVPHRLKIPAHIELQTAIAA